MCVPRGPKLCRLGEVAAQGQKVTLPQPANPPACPLGVGGPQLPCMCSGPLPEEMRAHFLVGHPLVKEPFTTQQGPQPLHHALLQGRPEGHTGLQVSRYMSACFSQNPKPGGHPGSQC